MRTIATVLCLIIFALLSGAFLAVPVHNLLHPVIDQPFHKIISHISILCGFLFIFLYLRINNILNREITGFAIDPSFIKRDLITGISAGIGIMIMLEALLLIMGVHQFEVYIDFSLQTFIFVLLKAMLTGLLVGLIEETLFRGALLGGLCAKTGTMPAVVTSSLIYSAVHFIKYRALPVDAEIDWHTGLEMLPEAFSRFGDPAIIDTFLSLFAFGVLLSLVRLKNGNIIQCIGLHAGVVFAIKLINYITDFSPGSRLYFLVGEYNHLLGYLAFAWLAIIISTYYSRYFKRDMGNI